MTSYVNLINEDTIEFYANEDLGFDGIFFTWLRSLNTQKWLGPFPLVTGQYESNARYTKWLVDTEFLQPGFADEHRNGYYHLITTPIPEMITPTYQQVVKLVFDPGGDTNTEVYVSNNEEREADTYFRPNY